MLNCAQGRRGQGKNVNNFAGSRPGGSHCDCQSFKLESGSSLAGRQSRLRFVCLSPARRPRQLLPVTTSRMDLSAEPEDWPPAVLQTVGRSVGRSVGRPAGRMDGWRSDGPGCECSARKVTVSESSS